MPPRQKLPTNWPERERLRTKGQFWTPDWVAEAMVCYAIAGGHTTLFDPAVGAGAFFHAAKRLAQETGTSLKLFGTEIDPDALSEAKRWGLSDDDLKGVQIADFVLSLFSTPLLATVGNPPYIRHHRLSDETKARLKALCHDITGFTIDGRAGLHIYFLLKALALLEDGGRLAFIMPADTVEGVFARKLWAWIVAHYRLDTVVTFAPEASPFPGVDTNALIFFIRKAPPTTMFHWVRCIAEHSQQLKQWVLSGFEASPGGTLDVRRRSISEGIATGLSRFPISKDVASSPTLARYARIMRGIATGSNEFFFLTRRQVQDLHIPDEFLRLSLGRTRDVPDDRITAATIEAAHNAGRPTLLFAPDGRPLEAFPESVQAYLAEGVRAGLPSLALIKQRKPWYKMEVRLAPPFLFAYLGRRNARFIRNDAGIIPLTTFLCVYPHQQDEASINALWSVLSHPETVHNLRLVGKSYGDGAIKVEPRALEALPLPKQALHETGLAHLDQLKLALT